MAILKYILPTLAVAATAAGKSEPLLLNPSRQHWHKSILSAGLQSLTLWQPLFSILAICQDWEGFKARKANIDW